ncbi:TRAG family protein, partial [Nocardiopsis tropica]|nr:TRAG family protein [Nocardiopsis tropica]
MSRERPKYQVKGGAAAAGAPPLLVLIALWGTVGLFFLFWLAARIVASLTGGTVGGFGMAWVVSLVVWDTGTVWPGTPTLPVVLLFGVFAALSAALLWWVLHRVRNALYGQPDAIGALNKDNETVAELARPEAADKAVRLRRTSLAGRRGRGLKDADVGLTIGDMRGDGNRTGARLFASWEDTVLAFMAPRAGKTT